MNMVFVVQSIGCENARNMCLVSTCQIVYLIPKFSFPNAFTLRFFSIWQQLLRNKSTVK